MRSRQIFAVVKSNPSQQDVLRCSLLNPLNEEEQQGNEEHQKGPKDGSAVEVTVETIWTVSQLLLLCQTSFSWQCQVGPEGSRSLNKVNL